MLLFFLNFRVPGVRETPYRVNKDPGLLLGPISPTAIGPTPLALASGGAYISLLGAWFPPCSG